MEHNVAAVLHGVDDIRMENIQLPNEVSSKEVLLRMSQVGICGSDISYWKKGRIGSFIVNSPMVIGHEGSGVVAKCGSDVKHLKEGDRVTIEPGVPCRMCKFCKTGKYNLCRDMLFCATPPVHGNLAQYYKQAADFCYKLPDNVSLEEGALVEPLSVAVHACKRASVTPGSIVLVCGAGPIGLLSLLVAKAMGATKVCVTDVVDSRLKFAKELGADSVLNVSNLSKEGSEIISSVSAVLGGLRPTITVECSGAEPSIRLAILATESGGVVVLVGMGPAEVKIPIIDAAVREVDIRGIFRYANCYPIAIDLISSGRVDVKKLISHRFTLENTLEAFQTAYDHNSGAIKVLISC